MPEQEAPKVVLRGPAEGDGIILPMGGLHGAHPRKASRTETGGHWALGEAWQDPGFDNPPHTHDEAEAFYVLEGDVHLLHRHRPRRGDRARHLRLHPAGRGPWVPHRPRRRPTSLHLAITVEAAFFGSLDCETTNG